jgi:N6-adenosine-specific RNA methylase IME4
LYPSYVEETRTELKKTLEDQWYDIGNWTIEGVQPIKAYKFKNLVYKCVKRYNIIYIDPPWKYSFNNKKETTYTAARHYDSLDLNELIRLPIPQIAAENCALCIWVTNPLTYEVFDLIKLWGFKFKTLLFNWIKHTKNNKVWVSVGNYTRPMSELCWLWMKGSLERLDHNVEQVHYQPVQGHSKKPGIFRDEIVKLFGDLPRVELFARESSNGWDSWGDQLAKNAIL